MKTFEEWCPKNIPKSSPIYKAAKMGYEEGQRSMLPGLTKQEWKQIKYYHDYWGREFINKFPAFVKLAGHALEHRERLG